MTRRNPANPPDILRIEPATEDGIGLVVPLSKALAHLWVGHQISHPTRGFNAPSEVVSGELTEAAAHMRTLTFPRDLISEEFNIALTSWSEELTAIAGTLATSTAATPDDPITDAQRTNMEHLIRNAWTLMAHVDREVAGLPSDPGRRP